MKSGPRSASKTCGSDPSGSARGIALFRLPRFLGVISGVLLLIVGPRFCQAGVITDWNALALDAVRADDTGPTLSTRNLAMLHTAIYDAVNSIQPTHQPYRFQIIAPAGASAEAAAISAAYQVLISLYPSLKGRSDELYAAYLAGVPSTSALADGLALGNQIAQMTLQSRSGDGAQINVPYVPSNDPGQWRRTPPYFLPPLTPQWRYVTPFCLPEIEPFVPGPPPAFDSPEYARDFNEVKAIGELHSTTRTPEQSEIAVFWSDFSYTAMPPGHWHEIAAVIAHDRGLDLADTARLFALISVAQADAAIVCWEAKYRYNVWRPVTAIQRADEDNNPDTAADPTWEQFLNSPPFPSYTSGHSTFSKASAEVLAAFFGTDAISFSVGSDSLPGVFRSFTSLSACADEVGQSRIYGGFHFQFDNLVGKETGRKVADYIIANFMLPNNQLPQVRFEGFSDGRPTLRVLGHLGATGVLEGSWDLTHWQPLATNGTALGGVVVVDPGPPGPSRFYRVVE
jgi:membrane-associated phospholipid phosphatase